MIKEFIESLDSQKLSKIVVNGIVYWGVKYIEFSEMQINRKTYYDFIKKLKYAKVSKSSKFLAVYSVNQLIKKNSANILTINTHKFVLFNGSLITEAIPRTDIRLLCKLLFTSGMSLKEIIDLKWSEITMIENILFVNKVECTLIAIAAKYVTDDILQHCQNSIYLFPELRKNSIIYIRRFIDYELKLVSKVLNIGKNITSIWLESNFEKTINLPVESIYNYEKYILQRNKVTTLLNLETFKKLNKISSRL